MVAENVFDLPAKLPRTPLATHFSRNLEAKKKMDSTFRVGTREERIAQRGGGGRLSELSDNTNTMQMQIIITGVYSIPIKPNAGTIILPVGENAYDDRITSAAVTPLSRPSGPYALLL